MPPRFNIDFNLLQRIATPDELRRVVQFMKTQNMPSLPEERVQPRLDPSLFPVTPPQPDEHPSPVSLLAINPPGTEAKAQKNQKPEFSGNIVADVLLDAGEKGLRGAQKLIKFFLTDPQGQKALIGLGTGIAAALTQRKNPETAQGLVGVGQGFLAEREAQEQRALQTRKLIQDERDRVIDSLTKILPTVRNKKPLVNAILRLNGLGDIIDAEDFEIELSTIEKELVQSLARTATDPKVPVAEREAALRGLQQAQKFTLDLRSFLPTPEEQERVRQEAKAKEEEKIRSQLRIEAEVKEEGEAKERESLSQTFKAVDEQLTDAEFPLTKGFTRALRPAVEQKQIPAASLRDLDNTIRQLMIAEKQLEGTTDLTKKQLAGQLLTQYSEFIKVLFDRQRQISQFRAIGTSDAVAEADRIRDIELPSIVQSINLIAQQYNQLVTPEIPLQLIELEQVARTTPGPIPGFPQLFQGEEKVIQPKITPQPQKQSQKPVQPQQPKAETKAEAKEVVSQSVFNQLVQDAMERFGLNEKQARDLVSSVVTVEK